MYETVEGEEDMGIDDDYIETKYDLFGNIITLRFTIN